MSKKIELDFLAADLAAVEALLVTRTEEDDPIGHMQLTARKEDLQAKLRFLKGI